MTHRHISDRELIEGLLDAPPLDVPAEQDVAACPDCATRHAALTDLLKDVSERMTAEADAHFPAERLERQRARILDRVVVDDRPGRILAFPAATTSSGIASRSRPASRWIAAAAAAAFIVGAAAGHLVHDIGGAGSVPVAVQHASAPPATITHASSLSDEELLSEVDAAIDRRGPLALGVLDSITLAAWDIR